MEDEEEESGTQLEEVIAPPLPPAQPQPVKTISMSSNAQVKLPALGKAQAKKRLLAFSMAKQNSASVSFSISKKPALSKSFDSPGVTAASADSTTLDKADPFGETEEKKKKKKSKSVTNFNIFYPILSCRCMN